MSQADACKRADRLGAPLYESLLQVFKFEASGFGCWSVVLALRAVTVSAASKLRLCLKEHLHDCTSYSRTDV